MAQIGGTYRVHYAAKNLQTGLTGIVANLIKPDGSVIGTFPLIELSGTFFAGVYYFDLITNDADPVGDWFGMIYSPIENVRSPFTINFDPHVAAVAVAVWDQSVQDSAQPGTVGEVLTKKLPTVSRLLGIPR